MATVVGHPVSVYEMLRLIGRAGIATKSGSAEEISAYLRQLDPDQLIEEFHRAVVTLSGRGLLSPEEKIAVAQYARDWVDSQPLPRSL